MIRVYGCIFYMLETVLVWISTVKLECDCVILSCTMDVQFLKVMLFYIQLNIEFHRGSGPDF